MFGGERREGEEEAKEDGKEKGGKERSDVQQRSKDWNTEEIYIHHGEYIKREGMRKKRKMMEKNTLKKK